MAFSTVAFLHCGILHCGFSAQCPHPFSTSSIVSYVILEATGETCNASASESSTSSHSDTPRLVAVIVLSSAYGFVTLVLASAYRLFFMPYSGRLRRGKATGKKRAKSKDKDVALDAVRFEQRPSPIEQVLIQCPIKSS